MIQLAGIAPVAAGIALGAAPMAAAAPQPVYANCTEAREAAVTNITIGSEAHWEDRDRDGAGIACESSA